MHCPVHAAPNLSVLFPALLAAAKHFLAQQLFITLLSTSIPLKASVQDQPIPPSLHTFSYAVSHLSTFDFFSYTENRLSHLKQSLLQSLLTALCSSAQDALGGSRLQELCEKHLQGENTLWTQCLGQGLYCGLLGKTGFTQSSKNTAKGEGWSAWPPSAVSTIT